MARFVFRFVSVRFLCVNLFSTTSPLRFPVRFAFFSVRFQGRLFVFNHFSGSFLKIKYFSSHFSSGGC